MVYSLMIIPNHFNQDAVLQAMEIKEIIESSNIHITLDRVQSYQKNRKIFFSESKSAHSQVVP